MPLLDVTLAAGLRPETKEELRAALCGVDCAVIEANHDPELLRTGPYPIYLKRRIASDHGHLSNESAGALAVYLAENGAQQLILGHLSRENNTPRAALEAVGRPLQCFLWAAGSRHARQQTAKSPEAPSRSNEMRFRPADIRVPNVRRADTPSSGAATG